MPSTRTLTSFTESQAETLAQDYRNQGLVARVKQVSANEWKVIISAGLAEPTERILNTPGVILEEEEAELEKAVRKRRFEKEVEKRTALTPEEEREEFEKDVAKQQRQEELKRKARQEETRKLARKAENSFETWNRLYRQGIVKESYEEWIRTDFKKRQLDIEEGERATRLKREEADLKLRASDRESRGRKKENYEPMYDPETGKIIGYKKKKEGWAPLEKRGRELIQKAGEVPVVKSGEFTENLLSSATRSMSIKGGFKRSVQKPAREEDIPTAARYVRPKISTQGAVGIERPAIGNINTSGISNSNLRPDLNRVSMPVKGTLKASIPQEGTIKATVSANKIKANIGIDEVKKNRSLGIPYLKNELDSE